MNISTDLIFQAKSPAILSLLKTENTKAFVVGLLKDQVLAKHKTDVAALLLVLEGELSFKLRNEIKLLPKHDVFSIPVGEEHEVIGIHEKNSFLIFKYA